MDEGAEKEQESSDTECCRLGDDVADFRFELGVEHRAAKMKHVVVCVRKRNS